MGHTDVVPVNPAGWQRDPFAAELDDGIVWGRGATDMLHITATAAVALRHLAVSGFRPRGTLIYLAAADEEAFGGYGVRHLMERHPEAIETDYVVTEGGGVPVPTRSGFSSRWPSRKRAPTGAASSCTARRATGPCPTGSTTRS